MSPRPILIHPDPRLRKTVTEYADVSDALRATAREMLATMYDAPGIGLAGPQIGEMGRIFVMDCTTDEETAEPLVCINPRILAVSDEREISEEGCLSIPDVFADVERAREIELAWIDETGTPRERAFGGRWAVCAQHEIDHLDGKLFIDTLSPLRRQMITQKMRKLKRERARA